MLGVWLFLIPWLLIGLGVLFVAFSGGPSSAREAYLTGGNRAFRVAVPLLYVALGIAVPAAVIAERGEATGGSGELATVDASSELKRGRDLFRQSCAGCHSLEAINALGVTGPDLDEVGEMTPERVLRAIEIGGTGQDRMPPRLLEGESARAVAEYVSTVAGR